MKVRRNGNALKITKTDQRHSHPVYIGDSNVHCEQRKFSRQDRQMVPQLARAGNSNLAIADALKGNANCFSKTYLIGPDGISVTLSHVRRMKSTLMLPNVVLTEEILRQRGDDGLSRVIVGSDGEAEEIIFTTPHKVANFCEYGDDDRLHFPHEFTAAPTAVDGGYGSDNDKPSCFACIMQQNNVNYRRRGLKRVQEDHATADVKQYDDDRVG